MVFKRFRKNPETSPPHGANERHDSDDSQANMPTDPMERARAAREYQKKLGEAAIRRAELRRQELFGWTRASQGSDAQSSETTTGETNNPGYTTEDPQQEQEPGFEEEARQRAEATARHQEQVRQWLEQQERRRRTQEEAARVEREQRRQREQAKRKQEQEDRAREQARRQRAKSTLSRAEAHTLALQKIDRIHQADAKRRKMIAEKGISVEDQVENVMSSLGSYILPEDQISLASFDEKVVRQVIAAILSQRDSGNSDYKTYLGFMKEAHKNDNPRAVMLAQASGVLTLKYKYAGDDERDRLVDTAQNKELMSYIF